MTDEPTTPEDPTAFTGELIDPGPNLILHGDLTEVPQPITVVHTDIDGLMYVASAVPGEGLQTKEIDYRPALIERYGPDYAEGTRTVTAVESFLDELERRPPKPDETTFVADRNARKILATYDDHPGGRSYEEGDTGVDHYRRGGRRQDRLLLILDYDDDWKAWGRIDRQEYTQEQFGDLMEELAHTITEPDQAVLAEAIDNIRITASAKFESTIRRQDGTQVRHFSDNADTTGGAGELELPDTIKIRTRVYDGHPLEVSYEAWLRTRVVDKQIRFRIVLKPRAVIERVAWMRVCEEIRDTLNPTSTPMYAILEDTGNSGGWR